MPEPVTALPACSTTPRPSWSAVARLIRLHSQTGTLLLMLPTLWSLVLASRGVPPWDLVLIFTIGAFLMRSAGVVLNDLADSRFDRQVARTKTRPLASGELSQFHAVCILVTLLGLALALVSLLNRLTIFLSPIAILLAALYPFAKRFVHLPQAMLGVAFGWGTIMAWAASLDSIDSPAWMLFLATMCWAIGYDTIYALQDLEDDRRIGVKSSALFFGSSAWLVVTVSEVGMILWLGFAGWEVEIGPVFYVALAVVGLFCVRQALGIKNSVSPAQAFHMFHQHVWVGTAVLAGLLCGFLL